MVGEAATPGRRLSAPLPPGRQRRHLVAGRRRHFAALTASGGAGRARCQPGPALTQPGPVAAEEGSGHERLHLPVPSARLGSARFSPARPRPAAAGPVSPQAPAHLLPVLGPGT